VGKKSGDSQFWSGLMKVKDKFLRFGSFKVNTGLNTRFWEDKWLGNFKLQQRFPSLYRIVRRKEVSVASVFSSIPLNISFRRGLVGNNLDAWNHLVASIMHVTLNQ